jgi:phosphoglucosamine mutase
VRLFGTDGIRGLFGQYPVVPGFFSRLARATETFFSQQLGKNSLRVTIGCDTRSSGEALIRGLISGFSDKVNVFHCGVLPTPAIAYISRKLGCDCGFAVTASHNPYSDNGVKIFNGNGEKVSHNWELAIEKLAQNLAEKEGDASIAKTVNYAAEAREKFCALFENIGLNFSGPMVLDTANGAGTVTSPSILRKICPDLIVIGDKPDGKNINAGCGSENITTLCKAVKDYEAAVGIAHDGDGDRLAVVDESGEPVDGDQILGIIAKYLFAKNRLKNNLIVATEQSNSGLDGSLSKFGIRVLRSEVGDRNVYRAMLENDASMGGEESGHIILREFSNTGDAISAAVLLLKIMAESELPLSVLKADIALLPKKLRNIRVERKVPLNEVSGFGEVLDFLQKSEPDYGRVFVRYSGTENKLRVLVEARSEPAVDKILTCVCEFLENRFIMKTQS